MSRAKIRHHFRVDSFDDSNSHAYTRPRADHAPTHTRVFFSCTDDKGFYVADKENGLDELAPRSMAQIPFGFCPASRARAREISQRSVRREISSGNREKSPAREIPLTSELTPARVSREESTRPRSLHSP